VRSEEARPGVPVRVLDATKRRGSGRIGTVERTYGHPSYLAVEVRFEDGSEVLYWYHELQLIEEFVEGTKGEQESSTTSPSRDRGRQASVG
jgi:hypothetical protein